jgi:hypothetical protein
VRMSIRTEVGMPVKTKKPRSGAYRALSEPTIPNTGRWFVYSKMEPICGAISSQKMPSQASVSDECIACRKKKRRSLQETHGGDGGDRGREQVCVERHLPGFLPLHGPALALPGRRLFSTGLGPRGDLLLCLPRWLASGGQDRQPSAPTSSGDSPPKERAAEMVVHRRRPQTEVI